MQFESIELGFLVDFRSLFAKELQELHALQHEGLVTLDDVGIHVTPWVGMLFALWPWCLIATCRPTTTGHGFPRSFSIHRCNRHWRSRRLFMGLAGGPHCIAMCGAACAGIGQAAPTHAPPHWACFSWAA